MLNALMSVAAGYLIATGTTSAALVGLGLIRATKTALGGDARGAAAEVVGGLILPTFASYAALAGLCAEAVGVARELAAPAVDEIEAVPFGRAA